VWPKTGDCPLERHERLPGRAAQALGSSREESIYMDTHCLNPKHPHSSAGEPDRPRRGFSSRCLVGQYQLGDLLRLVDLHVVPATLQQV
jgi:hypothetical protein